MKKNIIALAIATAVAAPIAMADAPTVYGTANMVVNIDKSADMGTTVDSHTSLIGVKGSEDLGNGLAVAYKMEFGLNMDGSADGLTARNQYVGLAGGFGTILMGTHDTPLKMSQPTDLFNYGLSDNKNVSNVLIAGGEIRADNVIAYVSPSFSGVTFIAATVAGNKTNTTSGAESGTAADGSEIASITSVALTYGSKKEGLYLAAATNNGSATAITNNGEARISAQYVTGGLIANAIYQTQEKMGSAVIVSAGYKFGKVMPKIKMADTSESNNSGKDGTVTSVGLNYSLGKKTTAYIEVASFDKKFTGGAARTATTLGLQHKF
ncbi:MAG: hypothetical protein ISEC1_P1517 [Thiomicrorhabdus sp.]|nr:MAG: hypothetical protein ISEC1_P1517 [Thiomicrorhabdus sp.]